MIRIKTGGPVTAQAFGVIWGDVVPFLPAAVLGALAAFAPLRFPRAQMRIRG
jgi:hypothetical protein